MHLVGSISNTLTVGQPVKSAVVHIGTPGPRLVSRDALSSEFIVIL